MRRTGRAAGLLVSVVMALGACSSSGGDGGDAGADRTPTTAVPAPGSVEDGCPTVEAIAEIVGEPVEVNAQPSNATERGCDYESTDEDRAGTLLIHASPWDPDGEDDSWDRTRLEQADYDVADAPALGPEGFTAEVPFICASVLPGLSVDVTYAAEDPCATATRIAVAVADAWGIPH